MNKRQYIEHLLAVLSYDSMVDFLTVASRSWAHRQIQLNYREGFGTAEINTPPADVKKIMTHIMNEKWQRPELRYNSDRVLQVFIDGDWRNFKAEDYINN